MERVLVSDWAVRGEHDSETISGWSRELFSYDEIPHAFTSLFTKTDQFPYTIFIPEERGFFGIKTPATVIQLFDDHIVAAVKQNNAPQKKIIAFDKLLYIESGNSLLRSWINFVTVDNAIVLNFNQANAKIFKPFIDKTRKFYRPAATTGVSQDTFKSFEYLIHTNHKMMNYGANSLYPEDSVFTKIYQPAEIQTALILFNRKLFEKKTKPFILIFTNDEVIRFCDHVGDKSENLSTIGGIYTFIPRNKITNISGLKNEMKNYYDLNIQVTKSFTMTSRFYLNNIELSAFLSEIKSSTI